MKNTALGLGLKMLALIAFVAGVGVGLLALVAAAGVWFGWWDFRQGFSLLRSVNTYAPWIAGAGLVIGALVYLGSRHFKTGKGASLAGLALVGTVAAALAYYVPESYRPPEGTPPIHDISTDTDNPPVFVDIVPLRADAPNSYIYGDSPNLTPERLAELQKGAYPDIATRSFAEPKEQVFARALAAVDQLGWELVAQDPQAGRIEATDTTFWFRFKDDVVIRIREQNGQTLVDARSVSRVGTSDVGKNAQRLRAFFELL
ncbi:MAG: DUF1499 domain-containing protein [Cellvibrionaceae bacterium]